MKSSQPIGIFDSGVGGLSVLAHIHALLPNEDLLYVADNGHLPYGTKSLEYVTDRSLKITEFLIAEGAKSIVVACNTATAAAVSRLRERFSLPIIGMEPGVKPAIEQTENGRVAILATVGTLGSDKFRNLMQRHGNSAKVLIQPCHGWVELVEQQTPDPEETTHRVAEQLLPLLRQGIDTLVLGCTHYSFLTSTIASIAGDRVQIIDTGFAVAKQLQQRLYTAGLLRATPHPGTVQFWSSAPNAHTDALISRLWGSPCQAVPLPV